MAGDRAAKKAVKTEQGFGADFLERRIWPLMTLLAGVARRWHHSDWFGMLTSRQRNAACATRCHYCLQPASSPQRHHVRGYFHCVSATIFVTAPITGHFESPQGWGGNPSVLLPAGTATGGDG